MQKNMKQNQFRIFLILRIVATNALILMDFQIEYNYAMRQI